MRRTPVGRVCHFLLADANWRAGVAGPFDPKQCYGGVGRGGRVGRGGYVGGSRGVIVGKADGVAVGVGVEDAHETVYTARSMPM